MAKTAGIIVIGNEILSGKTIDQNSTFLARELRDLGVDVRKISVVPDDVPLIADEVRLFSHAYDYVFTTGGVGPTHDDLTMDSIALAFGMHIRRNPQLETALRGYYPEDILQPNLRMADVPEGAKLVGSSEGLWFPVVAVENVYIFPGVPEILQRKFDRIKENFREAPYHLREIFLRADEGRITSLLHDVMAAFPDLLLGSYPSFNNPIYSIKVTLESKDSVYLEGAFRFLIAELAKIDLEPVQPV